MASNDSLRNNGLFVPGSLGRDDTPADSKEAPTQHDNEGNDHDQGDATANGDDDDGDDDDDDGIEIIEGVNLEHSGKWCEKGKVLETVKQYYVIELRNVGKAIECNLDVRKTCEDVARAVESKKTNKQYLHTHHIKYMRVVRKAIMDISQYVKRLKEAEEKLGTKQHRDVFRKGILGPTLSNLENAGEAKDMLRNLIMDLEENKND